MENVIFAAASFFAVLLPLVMVHELGHFITAKMAGVVVQEFGFGYPPRLFAVKWKGTEYSMNLLPLG
ncbi:MAG: rane-associated zinc metalloprotease, partial [Dehalococcoidia bacterium]|nr:rane-associated zinc metalloprotease [Dehalococcoidia bacterium]